MSRLVHLSDLHFGTESPAVVVALQEALATLAPDIVVVSGDLTQRARRREFAAARRFLGALDGDVVVVPGNHDIPLLNPLARALWPFRRYREAFGSTRTMLIEHGRVRLIAVNSVRPERHASGRIGRYRRLRVAALAAAASPGDINIVVAHHPLGTTPVPSGGGATVQDHRTGIEWQRAGVHLVLSGHVHRPFLMEARAATADAPALWILNAGTAISRRLRHEFPNSFNVIDVPAPGRIAPGTDGTAPRGAGTGGSGSATDGTIIVPAEALSIERWDYASASSAFALHERRHVTLSGPAGPPRLTTRAGGAAQA